MLHQSFSLRRRLALSGLLLCGAFAFQLTRPPAGSTHEPITTKVMFNKEVARILQKSCWGCHSAGKIKEDIPLTTYEEARPWAKAIKEEVLEKRMPPFQAVKGYGSFHNDYLLSQREVELLVSWVEGGAPRGDLKDYPKPVTNASGWPLGQPDLILQPASEIKLSEPGGAEEEVRCISLPTNLKEDRWLSAVDFQPGNGAVVLRASFALQRPQAQARIVKASFQGSDGCPTTTEEIGHWLPGAMPLRLPAGVARFLPAGARAMLKIHYRKTDEPASDRSRLALYFAKDAQVKPLRNVAVTALPVTIQPGAAQERLKASYIIASPAEAVAIRPLLFPFAKSVEARAYRPDGTIEMLIWTKGYRYDWQPTYYFKQPVALPRGTRIEVTAYLDNSEDNPNNPHDPPAALRFAEPLCEFFFTAAPAKQARR